MECERNVDALDLTTYSAGPPEPAIAGLGPRAILKPGQNCWRVAPAHRAAVLVDGAAYFSALEAALRRARRSILIVGWDFDGSIRLRPDADPADSPPLGPLLRSLVEREPDLEIRILVWSIAVVHAPGDPVPLVFGADWQDHARLQVKLDTHHPLYAAHHQKIVCIDGEVAFVGGMDLTVRRWDTPSHASDDPHRVQSDGTPYDPVHDLQMIVDGEAARSVCEVARDRWHVATGEELPPCRADGHDPWPVGLRPDFGDIPVAIARTMPEWNGQPEVAEVAALSLDALEAARHTIYIEAQYLTAPLVGDVLERRLKELDGPEIVVILTHESHGLAERLVMGHNRDRLIRRLKKADRFGRLGIFYPCIQAPDGSHRQILVHAKLIIVDDRFLRVGSSNLNNRSIGLDTECDLAIETDDPQSRRKIMQLRNRLLGEHLGASVEEVAAVIDAEDGSLVRTIGRLNGGTRALAPFEAAEQDGPTRPVLGTPLLDPKRPFGSLRRWRRAQRHG
jgi:phosphatidylserine/phosphatidylglycerophosphate/cardiolipin synthase-like enzyme